MQLAKFVSSGEVPGLVALVARDGDVRVEVLGALSIGGPPVARDSLFRISSMSKPITAAATMMLVDDGALELDAPVERWLPELANRRVLARFDAELDDTVAATRPPTVRDLLAFTWGFGIMMAAPGTYPIQRAADELRLAQGFPTPLVPPAPDEWIRRLGTLPLVHQPGAQWMYHSGSDVLGVLIARASGMTFDVFLRERMFAPLGMADTSFWVPAEKRARFATSYTVAPDGSLRENDRPDGQWATPPAFPGGGGGLVSTVDDYLAFAEMLLGRGRVHLLSERAVAEMTRDQLTLAQKAASSFVPGFFDRQGWGFGVAVATAADSWGGIGTFGWDGGLGSVVRIDPGARTIKILMTQRAWTSPVPPPVADAFFA